MRQSEKKNYPTGNVIIIVSSNATVALALQNIRNSIWWSYEAKFLIRNVDNSCDMVHAFLKTVWAFNIYIISNIFM